MQPRRAFLRTSALSGALVAVSGFPSILASRPSSLRAGTAKTKVTPPLAIPYLTNSGNGTCAPFTAVHDDLFARALVLDDGHRSVALLAVDSIGYDNTILGRGRNFTQELRRLISAQTSLASKSIMLCATHTHQAPETIGLTNFREYPGVPAWVESHLHELARTVVKAWQERVPVSPRFNKIKVEQIGRSRRVLLKNGNLNVHGPLPPPDQLGAPIVSDFELGVLTFLQDSGAPYAAVLNYATHPVVTMLLKEVSADYPGATTSCVEKAFPGCMCLFTQGCAGDTNSIHVSTKFEDAIALGEKLGAAASQQIEKQTRMTPIDSMELDCKSRVMRLEPRTVPPVSNSDSKELAGRLARLSAKLARDGRMVAEIQAMRVGPVKWISFPGEPFAATGLELRNAGASFVVGYANGYFGYFPTRESYRLGGYEIGPGTWTRVAPGTAEKLFREGSLLLRHFGSHASF